MAKSLMFLGTGSDVGKSVLAAGFCRIFKRKRIKVAPFKAQNMSNNSYVTLEGGEIGRAQVVQAEACGLIPSVHMNPILLKPSSKSSSQIVVQGRPIAVMNALKYHRFKEKLKDYVLDSYRRLDKEFDLIVIEGAGSCCEVNLKDADIANFEMAKMANAKCIIVADIDRGGVFAQIIGTMELLDQTEKDLVIGFLINKFRGDPSLFKSGIEFIEKKTKKPVLGLIPFFEDIFIDSEDSVIIQKDKRTNKPLLKDGVNIAVIKLPAISNFTDFQVLEKEDQIVLNYITSPEELSLEYDVLILPGTKNVIEDAVWLSRMGWKDKIFEFLKYNKRVVGICGGYQLLGEEVEDPYGVESDLRVVKGLGLAPLRTILEKDKVVRKVEGICLLNNKKIYGYEIHMGRTFSKTFSPLVRIVSDKEKWFDGYMDPQKKVIGTYIHGIFDCAEFRESFINLIRKEKGLTPIKVKIEDFNKFKQREYDKLANLLEQHCDVNKIFDLLELD